MGLFGEILSMPFKVVGGITEAIGEVTETQKLTNIISKPMEAASNAIEEIDED